MGEGFITLNRSVQRHWIWAEPEALKFWIGLLLGANWKPKNTMFNGSLISVKRGQLVFGRGAFSKKLGISENKIRRYLDLLESDEMITSKKTTKYSIISITNYDSYQINHQQTTSKTTAKPPAKRRMNSGLQQNDHQQTTSNSTTSKEVNNNYIDHLFVQWWELYPRKVGKQQARKCWRKNILKKMSADGAVKNLRTRNKVGIPQGYGVTEIQYIKHPSTFINQGLWDEEPESSGPSLASNEALL